MDSALFKWLKSPVEVVLRLNRCPLDLHTDCVTGRAKENVSVKDQQGDVRKRAQNIQEAV